MAVINTASGATASNVHVGRDGDFIGGRFRLGHKIGSGSFGDIYSGRDLLTGEEVAMKVESIRSRHPQLLYEAKILKLLEGGPGVPTVHWYGVEGDRNIMVIDLLGPSLEDMLTLCNRRLSMKTALMLGDQLITRLEYVHSKSIIHRDVKPDNFLVGLGKKTQLFVIDFGLAKKYRDSRTQQHIPYRDQKALTGTARYASVSTHLGIEQSRRDDLEAAGYVLIYLMHGSLPWQGLTAPTKRARYDQIMRKKAEMSPEDLCHQLPPEFALYMKYCRQLSFEDRPDYSYLRKLFRDIFVRENYKADFIYDWHFISWRSTPERPASFSRSTEMDRLQQELLRECLQQQQLSHQLSQQLSKLSLAQLPPQLSPLPLTPLTLAPAYAYARA